MSDWHFTDISGRSVSSQKAKEEQNHWLLLLTVAICTCSFPLCRYPYLPFSVLPWWLHSFLPCSLPILHSALSILNCLDPTVFYIVYFHCFPHILLGGSIVKPISGWAAHPPSLKNINFFPFHAPIQLSFTLTQILVVSWGELSPLWKFLVVNVATKMWSGTSLHLAWYT